MLTGPSILPIKIMMEGKLHDLLRILDAEYEVHIRCLETLNKQQQLLMGDNRGSLMVTRCELNSLTGQADYLETERNKIIESISGKMIPKAGEMSVRGLLDSVKGPKFSRIRDLKRIIIEAYEKAERQRRSNESLIKLSLGIMRKTMEHTPDTDNNMPIGKRVISPRRDAPRNDSLKAVGPIPADSARTGGPVILQAGSDLC